MTKRLYRSGREKILGGVSGGLADYFEVDVTLVRLIWLITLLPGGLGFLAYILAWVIIPLDPEQRPMGKKEEIRDFVESVKDMIPVDYEAKAQRKQKNKQLFGMILVGLGTLFLFDQLFSWFRWDKLWPLVLIAIGAGVLLRAKKGGDKE